MKYRVFESAWNERLNLTHEKLLSNCESAWNKRLNLTQRKLL